MNHAEATALAKRLECFACGTTPCEPCHFPTHRGMGGDEDLWEYVRDWVPGCRTHHRHLDKTLGSEDQQDIAFSCAANYRRLMWGRVCR